MGAMFPTDSSTPIPGQTQPFPVHPCFRSLR